MKRHLISLSLIAAFAATAAHAADSAAISGIDTQYIDPSVRAQDDFFVHLNGKWLKTAEIPADKSSWGSFAKLRDDTLPQLRDIVEELQKKKGLKGDEQKIADLYTSYMDEAKLDQLGAKPLAGELARIAAVKDKKALPGLIAHLTRIGAPTPYAVRVSQDARESIRYAAYMAQSGLGLPDRDYYLKKDDAKLADALAKYEQHVAKVLTLAGAKDGAVQAKAIVALETALAEAQWTKVENRDPVKRYNKIAIDKLAELAPGYDWKAALAASGIAGKTDYVIVMQPSYLQGFDKLVASTDLATWKSYLTWHLLRDASPYLSKSFADAHFAFYGTVLTGVTEQPPRWKRGVGVVEAAIGEGMGKLYTAKHFPADRKARMEKLVQNLLLAYKQSIDTLDWMSPETRKEAQAKLAKFTPKIGYPDKWRDYSKLKMNAGDLLGNLRRAAEFDYQRNVSKLGQPIDRTEWGMTPQTVNAYYRSTANEIVFPAAILQPPFFDARADDAVNYGAIGAVIGHEISHGFDDSGSQSDGDGNLRDWWTAQDRANFKAKTDALVKQYDAYSPLPGYNVNGKLTLGENIADNSGLAIAYKAYKLSLNGQPAPVIDNLTGEQRFYMGFGQVWRSKMREAQQIVQVKTDPHSPGQFRANGTVVNQPGFYEAFGVKEGDKLYVKPEERVIIW
ncbi:M13 family metallopeptidase [Pseudoduganella chitinolytica]|uniref:M13 family peptidase n=1 Tax=Pseudoduganella chitinolytica TaxID=34070 RepID=A0ABY8B7C0_9BURK|nr:M13-type metalloendopeptidase [Pseudoduganella chitinolytica]WEF31831.1 M13 family peptidase [Pseudoduganella chitinolytica]